MSEYGLEENKITNTTSIIGLAMRTSQPPGKEEGKSRGRQKKKERMCEDIDNGKEIVKTQERNMSMSNYDLK